MSVKTYKFEVYSWTDAFSRRFSSKSGNDPDETMKTFEIETRFQYGNDAKFYLFAIGWVNETLHEIIPLNSKEDLENVMYWTDEWFTKLYMGSKEPFSDLYGLKNFLIDEELNANDNFYLLANADGEIIDIRHCKTSDI